MLSFIDFLKKYSTIPNIFLDDFFNIFNNIDTNDISINIEKVKYKDILLYIIHIIIYLYASY
jgi:hypothetical protein